MNGGNHGHADLGSFQLDALGQRWVEDLGSDDYNLPGYNSRLPRSPRWRYLRPSNRGHSTLTAALGGPPAAVLPASLQALGHPAPIARFHSTPREAHAVVSLNGVYAGVAWERGLALLGGRRHWQWSSSSSSSTQGL